MTTLKATDIFTPSDYPKHTYVKRDAEKLERRLRDALETPGEVVSVSGPSKAGKTVLVERVVGQDDLITLTGAGIRTPELLWERVLDWMGTPDTTSTETSRTTAGGLSIEAGGAVGFPGLAKGQAGGAAEASLARSKASSVSSGRRGMKQVISEIADSTFVLLIDDFHYMQRDVQTEVAKQIKEAARLHVKICTASVPHRADDVVRGNPELRGRVRAIDLDYWKPEELARIAEVGFSRLGVRLNPPPVRRFATEASGSPQLMQAICLQACFELGLREAEVGARDVNFSEEQVKHVLQETSTRTDFSSLVRNMHTGPKTRGTERKVFRLSDSSTGDVYRCVLLAMASDPPRLNFPYNELSSRIQRVCTGETPQAASVYQACSQMSKMAEDMYPNQRVLEWDDVDSLLDIIDPYFLFYLRWSGKLDSLSGG